MILPIIQYYSQFSISNIKKEKKKDKILFLKTKKNQ